MLKALRALPPSFVRPQWAHPTVPGRLPSVAVHAASSKKRKSAQKSASKSRQRSPVIARQAIWFHHILDKNKRKAIQQWAKELELSGASKIGYPGVIILEGHTEDVSEYTKRLKALPWAAIQVRAREEEELGHSDGSQDAHNNGSDSGSEDEEGIAEWRRLPYPFIELPDTELSLLGAMCKQARLGHLFAGALQLHSPKDPYLRAK